MRLRRPAPLLTLLLSLAACSSTPKPSSPPPALDADAYSHYLRGRIAALEGDDQTAAREFERAALAAPGEPAIAVALIEALLGARQTEAAERAAERAVVRWPERPEVQLAAGRVYRKTRRFQLAAAALERARAGAKDDELAEAAVLELGAVHVALEQPERAVALYRQAIEKRPALVTPRYRLLELLVRSGSYAAAEEAGRALIEMRPDHVKSRVLYSRALAGRGKKREAIAVLQEAFERSGGRFDVGARLFDALLDANQKRSALELLELLASAELDDDERVGVGRLFLRVGYFARAEAIADAVLAGGENDDAVELRAAALAGRREFEGAAEAIAALGDDGGIWAVSFAAEMLAHAGKPDAALARLDAADPEPHREIARSRVHELSGDLDAARQVLSAARKRWPRDRDLLYARAVLELRAGEHRAAAALADRLWRADRGNLQLVNLLGYILADGKLELPRARRLLAGALRRAPDSAGVLDSVGWLHFRLGDLGSAAAHLYRAQRLAPVDPEILFHVAVLERALGRRVAATRRLRDARAHAVEPSLRARIEAEMVRSAP